MVSHNLYVGLRMCHKDQVYLDLFQYTMLFELNQVFAKGVYYSNLQYTYLLLEMADLFLPLGNC